MNNNPHGLQIGDKVILDKDFVNGGEVVIDSFTPNKLYATVVTNYVGQGDYIFLAKGDNKNVTYLRPSGNTFSKAGDLSRDNDFKEYRSATPEEKLWLETCIKANKFIPYEEAIKPKNMIFEVGKWYKLGLIGYENQKDKFWHYIKFKSYDSGKLSILYTDSIDLTADIYHRNSSSSIQLSNITTFLPITDLTEIQKWLPEGHPDKIPVLLTPEEGKWYKCKLKISKYTSYERIWLFKSLIKAGDDRLTYASKGIFLRDGSKFTNNAVTDNNEIASLEPAIVEEVYKYFPEEKPEIIKEEEFCLKVGEEYEYGSQAGIWVVDKIDSNKVHFKSKEEGEVYYYKHQFPGFLNPKQFHLVKPKEKSMKFNIGDKVKFKAAKSNHIPIYFSNTDGIPKEFIQHGSVIFKKNEGNIKHIWNEYYIVSYTDIDNIQVKLGFKEDVLELSNLVGRWVKCLLDGAWSTTFKGELVKKDNYYQLFDIRDSDYYVLEGGNYCGLLMYGENQEKWKNIGFELMPEGFSPDKPIELKVGMYLKALKDYPQVDDWCVKSTMENIKDIIEYFKKFHNKSYQGDASYYGVRKGSAHCSGTSWGQTISTEEFYKLAGLVVKYPKNLYSVGIDPYDVEEVQEKRIEINLKQPKKGGILDTKVNSTYSVDGMLVKPKKIVLF